MKHSSFRTLGLTMGDPNGIGPEIMLKALSALWPLKHWSPVIFGDRDVLARVCQKLNLSLNFVDHQEYQPEDQRIPVVDLSVAENRQWQPGLMCAWGGESSYRFLMHAIQWCQDRKIDAIVTAPLCKEALHAAGHHFPGHTEMLSYYTNKATPIMMLAVDQFRAIHVTTHAPLKDAIASLTPDLIVETIRIGHDALVRMGITQPRFGIPGLNPHAGENGLFGTEEQKIIIPAIEQARKLGMHCVGPISPDTIFLRHRDGEFDAVIALYHDQAHIPLKLWGMDRGVNVTLGLPVIRTSVDHGTAFDKAPLFQADCGSMISAIELALRLTGVDSV
ncbi:MAG: 4-hydroxythreonine-4-phosphate dehydrogenase PdxA [SAR324 cluster bacterium]|nr:4-hydroxythreonine-4-phosphate dehydrogenase PdxA [SAR324 cluster bacterium]